MGSNQHYVPRFLLKNFSEHKLVYRYDKKTGRVEQKNIRSVCSQDDFYNLSLENLCENFPQIKNELQKIFKDMPKDVYLSWDKAITEIETKTGEIVKKILLNKNVTVLSDKERFMLCVFISLQMLRTSHFRNDLKTIMESTANKVKQFYDAGLQSTVSYKDWVEDNIGKNFDISAKFMSLKNLEEETITFANILFYTKNIFLIDTIDDNLYISDTPVVLHNKKTYGHYGNIGILVPGIEIYMPLSSHIILSYHCKTLIPPYNTMSSSPDYLYEIYKTMETGGCLYQKGITDFFNYLQLCFSNKYLIAKHDCFDYAKNIIKENPQFTECTAKLKAHY